jgi:hypothetical protein
MALDLELGADTAMRSGMDVAQRHSLSSLISEVDSVPLNRGNLLRKLFLVLLQHLAEFGIDGHISTHAVPPFVLRAIQPAKEISKRPD